MREIMDIYDSLLDDEDAMIADVEDVALTTQVDAWISQCKSNNIFWMHNQRDLKRDENTFKVFRLRVETSGFRIDDKHDLIPVPARVEMHVRGDVTVANTDLKDLKGLPQYIDGNNNVYIRFNDELESLEGCPNTPNGKITIEGCRNLKSLKGVGKCKFLVLIDCGEFPYRDARRYAGVSSSNFVCR